MTDLTLEQMDMMYEQLDEIWFDDDLEFEELEERFYEIGHSFGLTDDEIADEWCGYASAE